MATVKYLADIDLNGNGLNNAVIQNLSTAPSSPKEGQIYYNTNDDTIYFNSATTGSTPDWVDIGVGGDITSVVAGAGMTGGAASGAATLNVIGGTGITANANDIAIDSTVATLSGSQTLSNKTIAASQVTEISNLTAAEGAQLEAIGSTTISAAQWGYLGAASGAITNTNTQLSQAQVEDFAGGLFSGNTESGITATYQASDNTVDLVVGTLNQDTTGSAATAQLAANATTLATARTIGGVSFDGSANINLPGVNIGGNQATSGNAATATKISSITNANIVQKTATQTLTNKTIAASQVTEISNITAAEGAQIENIGTTTISATQWGYLGAASGAITNTDTNDDVSVPNLKTALAGGFGSNAVTIGDSDDVVTIGNDLVITGDLTVSGDTTTVNTATLSVEDPLIKLASGNTGDAVDTGFYNKYVENSTTKYSGLFRDVSAPGKAFTFFDSLQAEPGTTVNTSGTGYDLADIVAGRMTSADGFAGNLTGNVTGNTSGSAGSAATLTTARTIGGVSFNGSANINLPGVNTAGNQATSGLAGTATKLATARAINGVNFDGTAAITVTAAAGTLSGNTLKSTVVTSSLTSVGTIGTGVWNATEIGTSKTAAKVTSIVAGAGIDVNNSGVGAVTVTAETASATNPGVVELATTAEALAGSDTTRAVTAAGLAARSYREAIGDGSATAIAVTHSLGTRDVNVQMYDASSYETVIAQVVRNTTAQVTVTFNTAPTSGDVIILVTKVD